MKPWYRSKTLWTNALAIGVMASKQLLGIETLPDIDPAILAILNILLRFVTRAAVGA